MVTAVVGVETWHQPILWSFLYRDLFTFMIIGELPWRSGLEAWPLLRVVLSSVTLSLSAACSFTVTVPMSLYNVLK